MSVVRTAVLVLLVGLTASAPQAFAAGPDPVPPSRQQSLRRDLVDRAAEAWLSVVSLWSEAGCGLDPLGLNICVGTPVITIHITVGGAQTGASAAVRPGRLGVPVVGSKAD